MKIRLSLLGVSLCLSASAHAYSVYVTGSAPVTTQIMPALGTIEATLADILATQIQLGTAVVNGNEQVASVVSEGFKTQREMDILARQTERLEDARKSFTVPESICSESASGAAAQVAGTSRATASSLRSVRAAAGGALTGQTRTPGEDAVRAASTHAGYCTEEEFSSIGGTPFCPAVSRHPGGDRQVTTLYDGSGETGKRPDLTFSDEQIDAALAYMKNTARRSAGRSPEKMDLKTAAGQEYQGVYTEYQGITDAAAEPQLSLIAASKPNTSTRDVLSETLQSEAARKYYDETTSSEARRTGMMSEREFEAFEVGRRYANTAYLTDLQEMDGDNLIRELIRTQNLSNWLALGMKNQLIRLSVIEGQSLALLAEQKYRPQMAALEERMNAGGARGK
ncbi:MULTISPECIES: conjugal transfer protein TraW [Enterobacteriaceae]|uniref:conjugal transfer protein TraW n=1 Tax=Enterobacteriaceae TaxID=543 RepID=UPI0007CA24DC|nr:MULTISPECIES: conjugal transfer protein TraW [Klebsiella]MDE4811763.1 conjugal transfer protein TraW [Klebsiella pneumoniae]MEB6030263.1 conjugal transfer protein TraW [Klebsiella quasipneumoniae]SAS18005.1 Uncharacterised protein [Klebsiella pneumoniae]SSH84991.1 Uncharacterised protein [Klebsiella pneumoniae]HBR5595870.1 conjugal transfer protein TraW [Klebsiella pneumoniae]